MGDERKHRVGEGIRVHRPKEFPGHRSLNRNRRIRAFDEAAGELTAGFGSFFPKEHKHAQTILVLVGVYPLLGPPLWLYAEKNRYNYTNHIKFIPKHQVHPI